MLFEKHFHYSGVQSGHETTAGYELDESLYSVTNSRGGRRW